MRCAVGLVLSAATLAQAADWPQFRGPNGDGTTPERIRTDWPTGGPRLIWRKPLTDGFSSLAVSQGKVVTLVKRLVGGQNQEVCVALEASTGTELWARPLGKASYRDGGGTGDGPRSTPTIRGDRVFVYTAWLVLACLDLNDGRVLWSKDLTALYGAENILWENAASPCVEGDVVIVNCNAPNKTLLALRVADGSKAWQTSGNDRMTHASPVPAVLFDFRQVVFYAQSGLVSVNPTNGAILWRLPTSYNYSSVAASPVTAGNLVYASAAYGTGARIASVARAGSNFTVTQKVRKTGEVESQWVTPVPHNGYLYGCYGKYAETGSGAPLECYKLDTLELMWSEPGFGHAGGVIVGDKLVMLTEGGSLVLIEPTPAAYSELKRFKAVSGKCWNVPAVSEGVLYVRSVKEAAAFDVSLPPPPPVRLQASVVTPGKLDLRISNVDGQAIDPARINQIDVLTSTDATSPLANWSRLTQPLTWESGALRMQTTVASEPQRFFITVERP